MASRPATKAKTAAASKTAANKPGKPPPSSAAIKPATKAPRMAEPKKVVETVTLKAVFEQIAVGHEMPKKTAHAIAAEMVDRDAF
jgi:hypothetical protein